MPQTKTNTVAAGEHFDDSEAYDNGAFSAKFSEIAAQFEELNDPDLQERVKASGHELIEALKIRPELFDSPAHALIFTAIAKRHAERASDDPAEAEFALDAATLLALKKSDRYDELKSLIDSSRTNDEEREIAVFESFTDKALSSRLEEHLPELVLAARERLGITDKNEDPFRVRVLNIAGSEVNFDGMWPRMPESMKDGTATSEEEEAFWAMRNPFVAYRDQMIANNEQFKDELNMSGNFPAAFVATINGERTMCIPSPIARKLVEPDVVILSTDYTRVSDKGAQSDEGRVIGTLNHEYAHTQGGVALDNDIFVGIAIEELRAENQSNNNSGYLGMKQYLRAGVGPITGFNLDAYFESNRKESNSTIFTDLAAKLGLDAMLEIAMTPPPEYITDATVLSKKISEHLGGYSGVLERLYENADKEAMFDRMDKVTRRMLDMSDDQSPWFFLMRRAGLDHLADIYAERIEVVKKEVA